MTGRRQSGEGLEQLMIKAHNIICETWIGVMHELHSFSGSGLLCLVMMRQKTEVFSDDETEDRSV